MSKHKKKSGICQSCPSRAEGFTLNWNKNESFIASLKFVTRYKEYELRICESCGQQWLLNFHPNNQEMVDLIAFDENQKPKYEAWAKDLKVPTKEQMNVLSKIKGLNGDVYGNAINYIIVPCKVTLNDGQIRDFSYVYFTKVLPEAEIDNKKFFMINDIAKIEPSENALPYPVRLETSKAEEQTNSYAPTLIENPEGKVYGLNWTTQFFSTKNYTGSQFKLYKYPHHYFSEVPKELIDNEMAENCCGVADSNCQKNGVVVYADWIEGYEKMLLSFR